MAIKFSDKFLTNLKPEEKEYWKRELNGFCIRVFPSGIKAWYFIFTFESRKRYMHLGNYPEVSLKDARVKHGDAWKLLNNGVDPLAQSEHAKVKRRDTPTIADLADDYINKHAKKKKKSWADDERMLNKEVIPAWGKVKAVDIKKRDVVLLLEKVVERGSPVTSNRLRALIQKMFNFAVERDILEFNPCTNVKPLYKETPKTRALSPEEIKLFWRNLDHPDIIMSPEIKRALKLILVTGQRPGEIIGMHAREIKDSWWTIPKERTKTNITQRVYLTELARDIIGNVKGRDFIFPSPTNEVTPTGKKKLVKKDQAATDEIVLKPIGEKAMACALRRNIKGQAYRRKIKKRVNKALPENPNRLGIDHFTPHDLRHTAITLMAQCGVPFEHRERVSSHSLGKMDKIYNQHDYDEEKRIALETLSKKIIEICGMRTRPIFKHVPGKKKEMITYEEGTPLYIYKKETEE